jgi:hypothetical protein
MNPLYETFLSVRKRIPIWAEPNVAAEQSSLLNSLPFSKFMGFCCRLDHVIRTRQLAISYVQEECLRLYTEFLAVEVDDMFDHVFGVYRATFGSELVAEMIRVLPSNGASSTVDHVLLQKDVLKN